MAELRKTASQLTPVPKSSVVKSLVMKSSSAICRTDLEYAEDGKLVKTLNGMGYMLNSSMDEYVAEFVAFAATADGPVADLGCAFGFFTRQLLKAGTKKVIANDLCEQHLRILSEFVSEEEESRLILIPGDALQMDLENESLDGILAANWLHFLSPVEIRKAFKLFSKWLRPNGKLCVLTGSTFHGLYKDPEEIISRRKNGEEWPGLATRDMFHGRFRHHMPEITLFLDPDVLEREAKLAGLVVNKTGFIERDECPKIVRLDGRESAGLLATK